MHYQRYAIGMELTGVTRKQAAVILSELFEKPYGNAPDKNRTYQSTMMELFDAYKPYTDKGKLKNHCYNLTQGYQSLYKALTQPSTGDDVTNLLTDFADRCLRAKVYIETKYEQDLAQQQAFLENEPAESLSMQMA